MSAPKQYEITSKQLNHLHYDKMLTPQEIADEIGCTRGLIYNKFREFDIPKRPKNQNLKGQRFGKLTIQKFLGIDNKRQARWLCQCDCGNATIATTGKLNNGLKSCGCYQREKASKHKMSQTRPYRIWLSMKSRCDNPICGGYENYGGRGISYCKRWSKFENFWDDMEDTYSPNKTIHRIDNNGNYNPVNCKWVTVKEQNNLKRNSVMLTFNGKTQNASQWSKELGVSRHAIYYYKQQNEKTDKEILTYLLNKSK